MVELILREYPFIPGTAKIEALENVGGFSGARIWRIDSLGDRWCVRRWPQTHPTGTQLQWMHRVLIRAELELRDRVSGGSIIPVPMQNRHGQTYTTLRGEFWEVTRWMPGVADLAVDCSESRIGPAFRALALFHVAVQDMQPLHRPSPGIQGRFRMAQQLASTPGAEEILSAAKNGLPGETLEACKQIVGLALPRVSQLLGSLEPWLAHSFSLHPCIRDIWHQHLLFEGDTLTGIIDFGAMRIETVAMDLSRLLASLLIFGPTNLRELSLSAYQQIRPLSASEIRVIDVLVQVSAVLSGLNWVRWLLIEDREFPDSSQVLSRLEEISRLLQHQVAE